MKTPWKAPSFLTKTLVRSVLGQWGPFLLSALFFGDLWGMNGTKILELSESKKTLKINYGTLDGIEVGQEIPFYREQKEETEPSQQSLIFLGEGRAVKVFENHSLWYFKDVQDSASLTKQSTLYFPHPYPTLQENSKQVSKKKLVLNKNQKAFLEAGLVEEALQDDSPGESESQYKVEKELDLSPSSGPDSSSLNQDSFISLLEINHWEKAQGEEEAKEEGEVIKREIAEEKVGEGTSSVSRVNSEGQAERIKDLSEIKQYQKKLQEDYLYSQYLQDLTDRKEVPASVKGGSKLEKEQTSSNVLSNYVDDLRRYQSFKITNKNNVDHSMANWSDDLSDDQLKRYLTQRGIEYEKERQIDVFATEVDHEVNFIMSYDSRSQGINTDLNNPVQRQFSYSLGYEFYLIRVFPLMSPFSLSLAYRSAQGNYAFGENNLLQEEKDFSLGMNYYPFKGPFYLHTPLFYLGLGVRKGNTSLSKDRWNTVEEYSLISFPDLYTGIKYRFSKWMGLNFMGSMEKIFLENTSNASDNYPHTLQKTAIKFSAGLNVYF